MDMDDNKISKTALWAERLHAFQESGLSRNEYSVAFSITSPVIGKRYSG